MKKKILCLLVIVSLLLFVGCKKENKSNNESNNNAEVEAKIENLNIKLNTSSSFHDINFRYPLDAQAMNIGTYYLMDYMDNGEFIFRVAMYLFENKEINETIGSNENFVGTKSINQRDWSIYKDVTENGENMINYAYHHTTGTYTITFISNKNIDNFIDVFMNNVSLKKEDLFFFFISMFFKIIQVLFIFL